MAATSATYACMRDYSNYTICVAFVCVAFEYDIVRYTF